MAALQHLRVLGSGNQDESAQWLTNVIQEVWPYAANIAQSTLKEYVQPALKAAVPKGLPVPVFTKIDIGRDSIVVERVRVFERKYSPTEIVPVLEADIVHHGNPQIEMKIAELSFGITEVKIKGRIEILLRPLLNTIPLIGAAQIGFVNPPTFDYTLSGLAAFAEQSTIKNIMKSVVKDVLASVAVLPNRVAFKVVPNTDYLCFAAEPVGVLRVAVLSGANFPHTDRNVLKQAIGQSEMPDVYLNLQHGSIVHRTSRIDDNANPIWKNEVFDFVLTTASPSQELSIEAYDYDLGPAQDDFLGQAKVLVSDLIENSPSIVNLLESPENATPTVTFAVRWLPLSSELRQIQSAILSQRNDKTRPKKCSSLLLSVEIDGASHLPKNKRPFVRVRVGEQRFQTHPAYEVPGVFSVQSPDFEQSFHVPLDGAIDASTEILYQVLDLYSGCILGYAHSSLSEAVRAGPAGKIYNFALLKAEHPQASLRVRVRLAAVMDQPALWDVLAKPENMYNRSTNAA